MSSANFEILLIAGVVAMACALPGVFLVLRRLSLMSDAISHSILFGIVIAFFITHDLASPLLMLGATLTGLLTVSLTELIIGTRLLKEDSAIGLVFPVFFSLGVILISRFAENVHIDTDAVLLGEIAFAPFNRLILGGTDVGPRAFWVMSAILLLNILFILLFYKELKIATFDKGLAAALGFAPGILHYVLMTLVSITAVGAFDAVGSILVVALMITAPASAYLLTDRLSRMLMLSAVIGVVSSVLGALAAMGLDASIGGSMATMGGIIFLLVLTVAPKRGLLAKVLLRRRQRWVFASHLLSIHLLDHEGRKEETTENTVSNMRRHMRWEDDFAQRVIYKSRKYGLVNRAGDNLFLTPLGRETARAVMERT